LDVQQGISPRELSHLGERVPRPFALPDGDTSPEGIAPAEDHPPGKEHEHPRTRLPHLEQHRSIRVGAAFPETGDPGDVGLVQRGEDLVDPSFEVREVRIGRQGWELGNDVVGGRHGSTLLLSSPHGKTREGWALTSPRLVARCAGSAGVSAPRQPWSKTAGTGANPFKRGHATACPPALPRLKGSAGPGRGAGHVSGTKSRSMEWAFAVRRTFSRSATLAQGSTT
jgi:hypothetical protein